MVEARIQQLGGIFAVGIYGYAVMSNHLHVVLAVEPEVARTWTSDEVIDRWLQLYPARDPELMADKRAGLLGNLDAIARCRSRLTHLSRIMRGLDEFVARQANAEDAKSGRFWPDRGCALGGMPPALPNASAQRWPDRQVPSTRRRTRAGCIHGLCRPQPGARNRRQVEGFCAHQRGASSQGFG